MILPPDSRLTCGIAETIIIGPYRCMAAQPKAAAQRAVFTQSDYVTSRRGRRVDSVQVPPRTHVIKL